MKAVIGLGNPGQAYRNTRHNLGFMVIDELLEEFGGCLKTSLRAKAQKAKFHFKKEGVVLCKPLTYMNLSGEAVLSVSEEYKIPSGDILVICDDIQLALGRIKLKAKGSSGGHKGLASIIQRLKTNEFPRLRIGIAERAMPPDLSGYVLSEFSAQEKKVIQGSLRSAKEAVVCWLEEGIETAMNKFNRAESRVRETHNGKV